MDSYLKPGDKVICCHAYEMPDIILHKIGTILKVRLAKEIREFNVECYCDLVLENGDRRSWYGGRLERLLVSKQDHLFVYGDKSHLPLRVL